MQVVDVVASFTRAARNIDQHAATVAPHYFNWRKASIYGGTNEIQKNIIAKMVLGL